MVAEPVLRVDRGGEDEIYADLTGPDAARFPIFERLRAMGATSYFAHWQPVGEVTHADYDATSQKAEGVVGSWSFDGEPAAAKAYHALIREVFETLALVLSAASNREMGRSLLQVYLGRDAGARVLSGRSHAALPSGSMRSSIYLICVGLPNCPNVCPARIWSIS